MYVRTFLCPGDRCGSLKTQWHSKFFIWIALISAQGGVMTLRKRYSEFDRLRKCLGRTFPDSKGSLPALPPKSVVCTVSNVSTLVPSLTS